MAISPVDRENWALANILPFLLVLTLIATYRRWPLSHASYLLITVYLTLHTTGVHYTYAQMPLGEWIDDLWQLGRNQYDRVVHFSFGLLLTYPMEELFGMLTAVRGWLLYYVPVMTVLGLSGLWEIIEATAAQTLKPELGLTFVGYQGDVWDAQQDMAAALYGALLVTILLYAVRRWRAAHASVDTAA
jgi:putative membrane protein